MAPGYPYHTDKYSKYMKKKLIKFYPAFVYTRHNVFEQYFFDFGREVFSMRFMQHHCREKENVRSGALRTFSCGVVLLEFVIRPNQKSVSRPFAILRTTPCVFLPSYPESNACPLPNCWRVPPGRTRSPRRCPPRRLLRGTWFPPPWAGSQARSGYPPGTA